MMICGAVLIIGGIVLLVTIPVFWNMVIEDLDYHGRDMRWYLSGCFILESMLILAIAIFVSTQEVSNSYQVLFITVIIFLVLGTLAFPLFLFYLKILGLYVWIWQARQWIELVYEQLGIQYEMKDME